MVAFNFIAYLTRVDFASSSAYVNYYYLSLLPLSFSTLVQQKEDRACDPQLFAEKPATFSLGEMPPPPVIKQETDVLTLCI